MKRFIINLLSTFVVLFSFFCSDLLAFTPLNSNSKVQLGISGVSSYGRPLFANALYNEPRGWKSSLTNQAVPTTQLSVDGYPLYLNTGEYIFVQPGQNAGLNASSYGGRICVTWEGEADITIGSASYLGGSTAAGLIVNGKRYFNNGTNPNGIFVKIIGINKDNPPKNIKVWLNDLTNPTLSLDPAEQGGKEFLLHPSFVNLFGGDAFQIYRFMNLTQTADCEISNWSDRRKPSHCFQYGTINGVAKMGISYEKAIQICNDLGKDMWINVPAKADQNFVEQLARLIDGKDPDGTGCPGLNKNLRCFVEYSNEMGWTYWSSYCTSQGQLENPKVDGRTWAGKQKARVNSWFRNIVGADNEQYKFIHAIQTAEFTNSDKELAQACTTYGPTLSPSGVPDYIGITGYFGSQIEQYIFNEINYWDPAVRETELEKVFKELENRTLSETASVTGVDFTGGGISQYAKNLRTKYGKPFIAYEGGCGLNLTGSSKCKLDCKIAATGTTCSTNIKTLADGCGEFGGYAGSTNYISFLTAVHKHPLMKKMFEINNSLAKANGLGVLSQFGEVADPAAGIDYGYWGCLTNYKQDLQTAYRYQYWLDWTADQKDIREVGNPIGTAPAFISKGDILPIKVGEESNREILFGNGDGAIEVKMISRQDQLPSSLSFTPQSNKISITGVPQKDEIGTYYILYRLLDSDKDPAYGLFTLKVLPAEKDTLLAYDDFGTTEAPLYQSANGFGFSSGWYVQSYSTTNFLLVNQPQLSYKNLKSSKGCAAYGGGGFLTAGRSFDVRKFDYLMNSVSKISVGEPSTSLWFSSLFMRTANTNTKDIFRFLETGNYETRADSKVILTINTNGKFNLDCRNAANSAFISVPTTIDASIGDTFLIVMEFRFGLTNDMINLYINPINLSEKIPNIDPSATFTTENGQVIRLAKFGYYGHSAAATYIDDLRFGDSYKSVTPIGSGDTAIKPLLADGIKIFRNKEFIQISSNESGGVVQIFNIFGQMLSTRQMDTSAKFTVPSKGTYVVKYVSDSGTIVKKITF
ncbi:MAG: T9SS type A sorting domain-containing protein [Bacteroidales bacterium]|nr:T9SS type A sorting domain-containing protein [Bacteroidales bacterium]